jgi:hypothetical protein
MIEKVFCRLLQQAKEASGEDDYFLLMYEAINNSSVIKDQKNRGGKK